MAALLEGRVAIVTGGGRGIGRAIVEALATAGAKVVVADNGTGIDGNGADPSVAAGVAMALDGDAVAFADSIASPGSARAAVDLAIRTFGGIDIVVNNAAIQRDSVVFRADPRDWEAVIRTNLSAPFYLTQAASALMREQGKDRRGGGDYDWGRIVNIGSAAGLYGHPGQAADASAKAGLFGLTRVTAIDLAPARITANAIAPFPHTRMIDAIGSADDAERSRKEHALQVDAGHVARLVVTLCGAAANAITGQFLGVRGREVFLFGQPRPVARLSGAGADWTPEALLNALHGAGAGKMTDLSSDPEAFNTEPPV